MLNWILFFPPQLSFCSVVCPDSRLSTQGRYNHGFACLRFRITFKNRFRPRFGSILLGLSVALASTLALALILALALVVYLYSFKTWLVAQLQLHWHIGHYLSLFF